MTWIRTVEPDEATGSLREAFEAIGAARGSVAAIHRVQGHNERALRAHLDLYKAVVFQRSSLSRIDRERIAMTVSFANRCPYCIAHHARAARNLKDDPEIVAALERGELPETLPRRDQALLAWARTGASEPATCREDDVRRLRELGLDERAVLDAALTVSYFSFVNRLVLLLGVELESDYEKTCGA
jgi:uncharacterized peroxidase-related enzyme